MSVIVVSGMSRQQTSPHTEKLIPETAGYCLSVRFIGKHIGRMPTMTGVTGESSAGIPQVMEVSVVTSVLMGTRYYAIIPYAA